MQQLERPAHGGFDDRTASPALERIPVTVHRSSAEASRAVAAEIAALLRERAAQGRTAVLGLATGSTPQASTRSWSACTARRG